LPGCSVSPSIEALESRLERTEVAKSVAEELAYERLAEIQRLQTQLAATEAAKAYAETLAFGRLEELNQTNDQLDAIQSSTGYKLLKIIKLAPDQRGSDV
jgi:flagellar motility protein MotE (MotC chaperone)